MNSGDETVHNGLNARIVLHRDSFALDVVMRVAPGEVLGVLGPNGAGKSTIVRALAGLERLGSGHISLAGRMLDDGVTSVPPEHRRVGVVFQNYRLFPHLSVRDNVAFGLLHGDSSRRASSRGVPCGLQRRRARRAARDSAQGWLTRFGIGDLAARAPRALSGGQAQRVALARALAPDPGLVLLDEPLAALDTGTRALVRAELRGWLSAVTAPTVLITHDPVEAMVMADRLLVVENGRVVQVGTPAQVARRPAGEYIARLVGMNLYSGVLRSGENDGDTRVEMHGGGALRCVRSHGDPASGTRVLLAVRPAAIALHAQRPQAISARNVWQGTVRGWEPSGGQIRVDVAGAPGALVDCTPAAIAELSVSAGSSVWMSAKATDTELYPDPAAS